MHLQLAPSVSVAAAATAVAPSSAAAAASPIAIAVPTPRHQLPAAEFHRLFPFVAAAALRAAALRVALRVVPALGQRVSVAIVPAPLGTNLAAVQEHLPALQVRERVFGHLLRRVAHDGLVDTAVTHMAAYDLTELLHELLEVQAAALVCDADYLDG